MKTNSREKKSFREHFVPSATKGTHFFSPSITADPAQFDRYEFRMNTSKEVGEEQECEEEELEMA